jgi:ABC-2 type transport system permease protein
MIGLFKYEFLRITSLRSSWVLTILGTLMVTAITFLGISELTRVGSSDTASEFKEFVTIFVPLWGIWAATVASQAFGHDYRHGTIRLTLSTFPNRLQVYVVRVLAVVIWCAIWLAVTIAIVLAEISLKAPGGLLLTDFDKSIFRMSVFFLLFILSAIAIVMITRILALGTIVPLMMATTVENLVAFFIPENLKWTAEYYPYSNAMNWAMPWNFESTTYSVYPLAILTAALLAIAGLMFLKRDA